MPEQNSPQPLSILYKTVIVILVGMFIFGLGIGTGYALTVYVYQQNQPSEASVEEFALFWEVWNIIEDKFYNGPPNSTDTTYGAIRGALASLDDPYTIFVEPQPRALERAELDGQFGGIGAFILRGQQNEVLLDPMVDSPAEQAGLQKGDLLLTVDGTPVTPEMTSDEIVLLVRGDVGTEVEITVSRQDTAEPLTFNITRAIIETPSVEWHISNEDPGIGYIKIRLFSNRTGKELDRALTELADQGATRYILDLRGNGGGLLEAAIDTASKFLDEGSVLIEDRRGAAPKIYNVRRMDNKILEAPLVVLIDGGSASASEIVAGALQDHKRATLIGERTYGKGSVQLVYDLSDASSLHVTVAKWLTPDNNSIDGSGLTPDIEVLFSEQDHANGTDPQYLRAIEFLNSEE